MSVRMTVAEREAFLDGPRTAILSVAERDGGTLASPVWYRYRLGGDFVLFLEPASRKVAAIEAAGRATLTVQDEGDVATGRPPRFVSVTGAVVTCRPGDATDEEDFRAMFDSYLPGEIQLRYMQLGGDAYVTGTTYPEGAVGCTVHIRPERWLTRDYGKAGERWDNVVGIPGASQLR